MSMSIPAALATAVAVVIVGATTGTGIAGAAGGRTDHGAGAWKPCKLEDSRNCVWQGNTVGNKSGRSFVTTANDRVIYVSHREAARLLGK